MVAQSSKKRNHEQSVSIERQLPEVHAQLDALLQWVCESAHDGSSAHAFERGLFEKVLELGASLFQAFLRLVGPGDFGESVTLDDKRLVHRSEKQHERRLVTVFGEFSVSRWVYAQRAKARIEFAPTDQRLQLPASEVSYLLQEWDQLLGVEQAFGRVREVIKTILRLSQSVDTLERTNQQMACIGCVHSVDRHVRTPEELVATLFRDSDRPKSQPPQAQNKRYWAELSRELDGEEVRGQDLVFGQLQVEIDTRRKPRQWLVHLCDGQASLETDRQAYLPEDAHTVDILDLMHVLTRVWEAAHVFHAEGSDEASAFVRDHLTRILHGQAGNVIAGWRRKATRRHLTGPKKKNLRALCAFLEKNKHRMRYDAYLRLGCPVATRVIEGACSHVIKDRMERAGMRWQVPDAQAMLNLRTIHTNGDWAAFQDYRIALENYWHYPNTTAYESRDWTALQAA